MPYPREPAWIGALFAAVLAFQITFANRASAVDYLEEPTATGVVCVGGSESQAQRLVLKLNDLGGRSRRNAERDGICLPSASHAVDVPEGLEAWSIEQFKELGGREIETSYAMGTAGGSGFFRVGMDPRRILREAPTGKNIDALHRDVECKLRAKFGKYFDSVSSASCEQVSYKEGLCFDLTLWDHTAKSKGFNSRYLAGLVSDNYWFRSKMEIWMGCFADCVAMMQRDQSGDGLHVHLSVYSSKWVFAPPTRIPASGEYRGITNFEPAVAEESLDDELNRRAADIFTSGKMVCSR